jgi:hypothetical protein
MSLDEQIAAVSAAYVDGLAAADEPGAQLVGLLAERVTTRVRASYPGATRIGFTSTGALDTVHTTTGSSDHWADDGATFAALASTVDPDLRWIHAVQGLDTTGLLDLPAAGGAAT